MFHTHTSEHQCTCTGKNQKHEWTFQMTLSCCYKDKERHRKVLLRDWCYSLLSMTPWGYNKKLRVRLCELVQTAETGCSWRLLVPLGVFDPLLWMLRSVCNGCSVLWRTKKPLSVGQQLVFCKFWLLWENMCDHWQPLKYSWTRATGTTVGSVMHWLTGEPTQPSGVSDGRLCCMKIRAVNNINLMI